MRNAIEKWQASVIVLVIVLSLTLLAFSGRVDGDVAANGLYGLGNLLLGAGAVAHGVRQGSKATADPPPES